jgi:hypothetical protein
VGQLQFVSGTVAMTQKALGPYGLQPESVLHWPHWIPGGFLPQRVCPAADWKQRQPAVLLQGTVVPSGSCAVGQLVAPVGQVPCPVSQTPSPGIRPAPHAWRTHAAPPRPAHPVAQAMQCRPGPQSSSTAQLLHTANSAQNG